MTIFCPHCHTYFPTGDACPSCGWQRPRLHTPAAPGQPLWAARLPGRAAAHLLLSTLDDLPLLLAGWGFLPRRADTRPQDGGIVALRPDMDAPLWSVTLGMPVQGGPALAGESILVGYGEGGVGAGKGGLAALSIAHGETLWRLDARANVRGAVTVAAAEGLAFFTADDGQLHALQLRNHEALWQQPAAPKAGPMPASPALVRIRGRLSSVIAASYTARFDREPARITSFDLQGRVRWQRTFPASVRDQPLVDGQRLFVAGFAQHPSAGVLAAYDAHSCDSLWPQPFRVEAPPGSRRNQGFVAQPLLHKNTLYLGSLNHTLYAIDAATGKERWRWEAPHGIITRVALVEGLLIFGDTAGCVHALDMATRKEVWAYDLGAPISAHPLVQDGVIFVAADNGQTVALPWHGGRYAWAAQRLVAAQRWDEAGDLWALAAHFHPQQEDAHRQEAQRAWKQAARTQKVADFLLAAGEKQEALTSLMRAAQKLRLRDRGRSASLFWRAHGLAFRLSRYDLALNAAEALADLLSLPQLQIEPRNAGEYTQGEAGRLTLRIENVGAGVAPDGIHFWLGGGLQEDAIFFIQEVIQPGQMLNIPLTIVPTAKESALMVEYRYATGRQDIPSLRGVLEIPIHARPPRAKPVQIGDVQHLHVTIAAATEEGVAIETGDVALLKSQGDIGDIHIDGDAGAVIQRGGDMGDVSVGGDVGFIRKGGEK